MISIYLVRNSLNGKVYLGQTKHSVLMRWRQHVSEAKRDARSPLNIAIRKYGPTAFEVDFIGACPTREFANRAEASMIAKVRKMASVGLVTGVYNITSGGESGFTILPESAKRRGELLRGRIRSAEHRRRLSESNSNPLIRNSEIAELYSQGIGATEVAHRLGICTHTVLRRLRSMNIEIRSTGFYSATHGHTQETREKCRRVRQAWWDSEKGTKRKEAMCLRKEK